MAEQKKRRSYKQEAIYRFLILAVIVLLLNILASRFSTRVDLTADKRFTLSDSTIHMLRGLNDKVFVKIYLTGDLRSGFKRLENSTRDLLNEFRTYADDNVQYQFEDPLLNKTDEEKKKIYEEMMKKGLQPTNIQTAKSDAYSEKIVIPGATIYYHGKETSVNLLLNDNGVGAEHALNNSVARIENKFSSAIRKLSLENKVGVGFLRGNRELPLYNMYDIITSLSDFYQVDTINLQGVLSIPADKYKVLVIAKPAFPFDEKDKFKLDQYIMNGGSILWLLDNMRVNMDSLQAKASYLSMDYGLNLDDQLFTYGCRLNPSLLMDLQCNPVPLLVNYNNGQPEFRNYPFYYNPVFTPISNHIITKEIDAVAAQFASTLDTAKVAGVKKTVLLTSSRYSKEVFSPWLIDLRDAKEKPNQSTFNKQFLTVGLLLEGKFPSVFNNRLDPSFQTVLRDSLKMPFRSESKPTKQIIISDGDIIKNDFSTRGQPYSLGYYKYTGEFFANKNFLLNCIDYLTGHEDQIITRSKDIKLRLLDTQRVTTEKLKWQLINILLPILLIIIFGIAYTFVRLRRYAV